MTPTRARLSAGLSAVACLVGTASLVRAADAAGATFKRGKLVERTTHTTQADAVTVAEAA